MKRLLKEPLVHFLVLGALLFAGYSRLNRNTEPAPGRIVISQGQLASVREAFFRTRQRPPSAEEWEGLVRALVREEVYYREALTLGLDRDDTIIRRRLQQKMEFISNDIAAQQSPTEAGLQAYLDAHPDKFRQEPRFTFRQVFLNPEKHGAGLADDAAKLLARLNQSGGEANFADLGDPFMLENNIAGMTASQVTNQFGAEFTAKLAGLPPARWQGPIPSGFGVHLVFVSERTEARQPALADVRDAVRREWEDARRAETNEAFYRELLKHYSIVIEPEAADTPAKPAPPKAP